VKKKEIFISENNVIIFKRGTFMEYSYKKMWKTLIDKNMKKTDLMREASLSSSTVAKMSKNLPVSLEVLGRICQVLHCNVGDILDILY
jgi:DNA-binding Xre family transcriptional regulator